MFKLWRFLGNLKTRTWLLAILAVAVVERAALYFVYRPITYNDTGAYRRLAGQISAGWSAYDGTRMPGYPMFMAWVGPDERVYLVQLFLGVLITLLFFYIGWRMSRRGWFAALTASAYTLNIQQLLIEADLLTETLTIFLLAVFLAGLAWLVYSNRKHPLWHVIPVGLALGVVAGLTALTRTLFVFLPFLAALVLLVLWPRPARDSGLYAGTGTTSRARFRVRVGAALAVALAGLTLVGLWANFIHERFGMWSLDTMGGYHLMNHVGPFFEYAPDEYAELRDTFIQYRDAQIAETGHPGNAIWDAIPSLEEVTGLGFIPLSSLLAKISIQLIIEHPGLYLRNVAEGWVNFWRVPIHWARLDAPLAGIQRGIILFVRVVLVLVNAAFIGGTLALILKKVRCRVRMDAFTWLVTGMVWAASILQALVEYGDNTRYSLPTHALVLVMVMWWGFCLLEKHETSLA